MVLKLLSALPSTVLIYLWDVLRSLLLYFPFYKRHVTFEITVVQ